MTKENEMVPLRSGLFLVSPKGFGSIVKHNVRCVRILTGKNKVNDEFYF